MSYYSQQQQQFLPPFSSSRPTNQKMGMGGSQAALFEGRNAYDPDSQHVDYYFVKKLTLALEQLSLAREGRVEYDSSDSGSESSTPPSASSVASIVARPVRRFNIPLLSLTDPKAPQGGGAK